MYRGRRSCQHGERAADKVFLKQRDHLFWLPAAKLFYQSSYCWLEGKMLVNLHFFSLALDKICVSWVIKHIAYEGRNKLSLQYLFIKLKFFVFLKDFHGVRFSSEPH